MGGRRTTRYAHEPDYAVAPGRTLQETIDCLDMTQCHLALRTGLAPKTVNEIINGKAPITPDTAVLLERATGVPARMWNNLEAEYRGQLAKIADRARLETDLEWVEERGIPVKELIRRKIIEQQSDKTSLLQAIFQFFGVSNSTSWDELWMKPTGAFRKSPKFEAHPGALATWLRLGEIEARRITPHPYNKPQLETALAAIRNLTTESPRVFQPRMIALAAQAGVALVFIPEIPKCPVSGVARWLTPTKALIQLSLRYKAEDQFWFSFFHEAGHILHDGKKEVFIDVLHDRHEGVSIDNGHSDDNREQRANRFAADFLIPPDVAGELKTLTTKAAVQAFARNIGIAPGIVVGRLQHDEVIRYSHMNDLKKRFDWTK